MSGGHSQRDERESRKTSWAMRQGWKSRDVVAIEAGIAQLVERRIRNA